MKNVSKKEVVQCHVLCYYATGEIRKLRRKLNYEN